MAKIAQLIEAGDYLIYKGDWATSTAYNVNDIVTWTDGHLYEVIKAHTSSATLNPGNAEYYKAMTARKYTKITFSNTGSMSKRDKERLVEAIHTDPNAIIHAVYSGNQVILRPIDSSIYPSIGGIVYGATNSKIGFVVGTIVPTSAGDINFNTYCGNSATDETLAYELLQLSLIDVMFLQ